jgi:hypothetical protein
MVGAERISTERANMKTAGQSTPGEVNASAWRSQPATWQNFALQCSVADRGEQL